jgi:hypothetical protein
MLYRVTRWREWWKMDNRRMSHISVALDAKSARERYIRVAPIVIVIKEGSWNICIIDEHETSLTSYQRETYEVECT